MIHDSDSEGLQWHSTISCRSSRNLAVHVTLLVGSSCRAPRTSTQAASDATGTTITTQIIIITAWPGMI